MGVPGHLADWSPVLECALSDEIAHDPRRLVSLLEQAAQLLGCAGAQVIEWDGGRPSVMAASGATVRLVHRMAPGAAVVDGRPVAVAAVDDRRDLILIRGCAEGPFDPPTAVHLRALAALLGRVPAHGGNDAVATLMQLATSIVRTLDPDRVLLAIADAAARVTYSEIAGVLLAQSEQDGSPQLRMRSVVGNRTVDTERLRVPTGHGIAGKVLATGKAQRVDDYASTPAITKEFLSIALEEGTRSGLSVPVRDASGELIGVLSAWRRRSAPYTDSDQELLESLASLSAAGIVNSRRFQEQSAALQAGDCARTRLQARMVEAHEALAMHQTLTQVATEGLDIGALAEALHMLLAAPIVIVSRDERNPVGCPSACHVDSPLPTWDDQEAVDLQTVKAAPEPEAADLAWPRWVRTSAEAGGICRGSILALLPAVPNARQIMILEHGASLCAGLMLHETLLKSTVDRLRSEFLWGLLEGRAPLCSDITARMVSLGLRISFPARILLVETAGLGSGPVPGRSPADDQERNRNVAVRGLEEALAQLTGVEVPVAVRDGYLAAIVPSSVAPDTATLTSVLRRNSPLPALSLWCGISSPKSGPHELAEGLREARVALTALERPPCPTRSDSAALAFENLGVLQYLFGAGDASEVRDYARRVLGDLIEHDADAGSELMATLDAYLANGGNASETARQLHLHVKSVQYRMRQIGRITGLDLNDREDRLDAELALRIVGALEGSAS